MDTGLDALGFLPAGRGQHRSRLRHSGDPWDVPDFVYAYRFGICYRMENGFDGRFSRRHDAAPGADVDGFRRTVPHGHSTWHDQGSHVGQSDDLLRGAIESYIGPAECRPRRG